MKQQLTIYLVRHSKPSIQKGVCYGQLDCTVSDDYQQQLDKIKHYFIGKSIDAIYSSPLIRCGKLAEDLSKTLINKAVIYKDAFKEINFGEWEGQRWDDIPRDKIEQWNENRLHFQFPLGETPNQFHDRVLLAWNELIESALSANFAQQNIVLVTHSGVICSLLCRYSNLSLERVTELKVEYASITPIHV